MKYDLMEYIINDIRTVVKKVDNYKKHKPNQQMQMKLKSG